MDESLAQKRFDPRSVAPFINKSVLRETHRAYRNRSTSGNNVAGVFSVII